MAGNETDEATYYRLVTQADDELRQGDIFLNYTYIEPVQQPEENAIGRIPVGLLRRRNLIVVTHSCDLEPAQRPVEKVVLCPLYPFEDMVQNLPNAQPKPDGNRKSYLNVAKTFYGDLIRDRTANLLPLPACGLAPFEMHMQVVQLSDPIRVPLADLRTVARTTVPRLRLTSPGVEKIAQAFGMCFMRVGWPEERPFPEALPDELAEIFKAWDANKVS